MLYHDTNYLNMDAESSVGKAYSPTQACQSLKVISAENKKLPKKCINPPLSDGNDNITC